MRLVRLVLVKVGVVDVHVKRGVQEKVPYVAARGCAGFDVSYTLILDLYEL